MIISLRKLGLSFNLDLVYLFDIMILSEFQRTFETVFEMQPDALIIVVLDLVVDQFGQLICEVCVDLCLVCFEVEYVDESMLRDLVQALRSFATQ